MSSNGSIIEIGSVTSNGQGYFSYKWTPPDEDFYAITATFAGDDSYWGSWGLTSLSVGPAPTLLLEPEGAPAYTTIDLVIIAAIVVTIIIGP